jgi:hypothetical protein
LESRKNKIIQKDIAESSEGMGRFQPYNPSGTVRVQERLLVANTSTVDLPVVEELYGYKRFYSQYLH